MSKPRRGYIAAGLAVAVVGSLGVTSTMNAGADEVPQAPPAVATSVAASPDAASPDAAAPDAALPDAAVPDAAAVDSPVKPPDRLPWGGKPRALTQGPAGATSAQLAEMGADAAPPVRRGATRSGPKQNPKGAVNGKRTLRQSRTTVPPMPPQAAPPPGAPRDVHYHYAAAGQEVESQGSYANLYIGRPKLGGNDYHSLAEIAVKADKGRQVIEVGWTVDRRLNGGSEDPHLFVYHWIDGQPTCYNVCGFVSRSDVVKPGHVLPHGVSKFFGIERHNDVWWVVYDSMFIGYFDQKLWTPELTVSDEVQWFGEVASTTKRPCSEMGTGRVATVAGSARIGSIELIGGKAPLSYQAPDRSKMVYTFQEVYRAPPNEHVTTTFRYGGPGFQEDTNPSC